MTEDRRGPEPDDGAPSRGVTLRPTGPADQDAVVECWGDPAFMRWIEESRTPLWVFLFYKRRVRDGGGATLLA